MWAAEGVYTTVDGTVQSSDVRPLDSTWKLEGCRKVSVSGSFTEGTSRPSVADSRRSGPFVLDTGLRQCLVFLGTFDRPFQKTYTEIHCHLDPGNFLDQEITGRRNRDLSSVVVCRLESSGYTGDVESPFLPQLSKIKILLTRGAG